MVEVRLIVIKTNQIDSLKHQYEALGFRFEHHRHGKGPFHYAAQLASCVFEIYPLPPNHDQVAETIRLGFAIENLKAKIPYLEKSNWKILSLPQQSSFGYRAVVQDVDGRKVELYEH